MTKMNECFDDYAEEICRKLVGNDPELKSLRVDEDESNVCEQGESNAFWSKISGAIKRNRTLESIDIVPSYQLENMLSVSAALSLSSAFLVHPTLKKIAFCQADFAEFSPIALSIREKELEMVNCSLTPNLMDSIEHLLKENVLQSLAFYIQEDDMEDVLDLSGHLGSNQSLKKLSICNVNEPDEDDRIIAPALLEDIARMLQTNQGFEELKLDLSNNDVTTSTLSLLANAAKGHQSLKKFRLSIYEGVHQENVQAVGDMLESVPNLQELSLHHCDTQSEGSLLEQVCRALQTSAHNLKKLTLSGCCIDGNDAALLSSALCQNKSIEEVCLCHNPIGDEGAAHLVRAVRETNRIINLNLCHAEIGPEGAKIVAGALRGNCSLRKLNFNGNPIGNKGVVALANALAVNTSLEWFSMPYFLSRVFGKFVKKIPQLSLKCLQFHASQSLSKKRASAFLEAIQRSTSIEDMCLEWLEDNPHFQNILPQVKRVLKLNKAGRRILSSSPSSAPLSLWPRILAKSSDDADTLYFFLRENPTLFMKQQPQQQHGAALGKRKRGECESSCVIS